MAPRIVMLAITGRESKIRTMKLLSVLIMFCVMLVATTANGNPVCQVPLTWKVGEIDTVYDKSPGFVLNAAQQAVALWESAVGQQLFVHDAENGFPINLIDNGAHTDLQKSLTSRSVIDENQQMVAKAEKSLKNAVNAHDRLTGAYERQLAQFNRKQSAYNREVQRINRLGGATELQKRQLERQRNALNKERITIQREQKRVERSQDKLQQQIDAHNRLVNQYNEQVSSSPRLSTEKSGDFQFLLKSERYSYTPVTITPREINVYRFANRTHLVWILAHEFGHALGLEHPSLRGRSVMSASSDIMYAQANPPRLEPIDHQLIQAACRR